MKLLFSTLSVFLFFSVSSFAANEEGKITSVQIREVEPTFMELAAVPLNFPSLERPGEGENLDWSQIILIGEKLIELIKANAPVVNITRSAVFAVPQGLNSWQELSGWQPLPVVKVFSVQMKNAYNINMVDMRLKVSAMYGGSLSGKGKYLANVIVVPTMVNVKLGVTLDVWSENRDPINIGSTTDPIAGLGFDLRYRVKTWVMEIEGTQDYFINGNGQINEL